MYLAFDLETESKNVKKRKGNPWFNRILCIGLKYQGKDVISLAQDYMPKGWLDGGDVLIGHNIKFDMLHIWRNDELQNYFKSGGRIWDTQLAEYILSGQQHKYPGLRDIAVSRYGCIERDKNLERYKVGKELDTTLIPIEELLEDVQGDVLDTEQVALQQVKIAKERGMYNLIKTQMDSLLSTTEMEFNGMYVHKETLQRNKKNLEEELLQSEKELAELAMRHFNV